jgi:hypothetical protein
MSSPLPKASRLMLIGAFATAPAFALPPTEHPPGPMIDAGEPVSSIPMANRIEGFRALDDAHVMVSLTDRQQYLMTLNRDCFGLRFARHVGVSTSDNTIWAGFDALTADGHSCPIRQIHRLPDAEAGTLH